MAACSFPFKSGIPCALFYQFKKANIMRPSVPTATSRHLANRAAVSRQHHLHTELVKKS
jgi:hypothetical protein